VSVVAPVRIFYPPRYVGFGYSQIWRDKPYAVSQNLSIKSQGYRLTMLFITLIMVGFMSTEYIDGIDVRVNIRMLYLVLGIHRRQVSVLKTSLVLQRPANTRKTELSRRSPYSIFKFSNILIPG
jgi:hypothetical protein